MAVSKHSESRLRRLAGQAVHGFGLIADGDRIITGVSGGKDSLLLIKWLAELRARAPVRFGLGAVHFSLGADAGRLESWLADLALDFVRIEPAPYNPALAGPEPDQCFICATRRRSRLFDLARRYDANLLALGHHRDDAIETFLMNILYRGENAALLPKQELFGGTLHIIRPFYLVPEKLIIELTGEMGLPIIPSLCPACGQTARSRTKALIADLARQNPAIPGNIASAARPKRP